MANTLARESGSKAGIKLRYSFVLPSKMKLQRVYILSNMLTYISVRKHNRNGRQVYQAGLINAAVTAVTTGDLHDRKHPLKTAILNSLLQYYSPIIFNNQFQQSFILIYKYVIFGIMSLNETLNRQSTAMEIKDIFFVY